MKLFFTFSILFFSLSAWSQNKYDSLNKPLPQDWYKESSVILSQNISYNLTQYTSENDNYRIFYNNEMVIRLNDKAAIEKYNSIEFPKDFELEIEVVNKDGSSIQVVYGTTDYWNDLNKSKLSNPRDFYKLIEESSDEKRKYAIPDLDTGDLIVIKTNYTNNKKYIGSSDRYYRTIIIGMIVLYPLIPFTPWAFKESHKDKYENSYFEYLNIDHLFRNNENTLFKRFEISLPKYLNVNYETQNGCKPFKIEYDKYESRYRYSVTDSFIIKSKNEIWSSDYLDNPYFSFKTYFVNKKSKAKDKEIFKSPKSKISIFSLKQVKKFYLKNERFLYINNRKKFRKYHENNPKGAAIRDPQKYIFEYLNFKKAENFNKFLFNNDNNSYRISFYSKDLVFELVSIAKRFLLPYNVYLIVPKEFGKLEDISSVDKFRYAIEINFKSGPITFYGSEINSLGLIKPAYLSGAEAYKIRGAHYSKIQGVKISKVNFPEFNDIEHGTSTEINIDLNPDTTITKIKRKTAYFGSNKTKLQYSQNYVYYYLDSILSNTDELKNSFFFVDPKIYKDEFTDEDLYAENDRLINSFRKSANEYIKQSSLEKLSEEFFVTKVDTSYLDFSEYLNDVLKPIYHTESFNLAGFSYKTPSGIVLNLGSLIESQVELIDNDDRVRTNSIVQPNLRKFENKIIINIPKGYKPLGLENFKFNIDNEVGSFISKPSFEDGKLEILVTKSYKKVIADKELWSSYLEFLDAANDFNYKKLILVKN